MSDSNTPDPEQAEHHKEAIPESVDKDAGQDVADTSTNVGTATDVDMGAELQRIAEAERAAKEAELEADQQASRFEKYFAKIHPLGWVAAGFLVISVIATILGSDLLVGRLPIWLWVLGVVTIAVSAVPAALNTIRIVFEKISDFTGILARILVWALFVLQLINVITRYTNDWFEQDILFGQVASGSVHSFAFVFMLGVGYAVKEQVNPRIDFWWGEFSQLRKAWLDFIMHTFFLLPFLILSVRVLKPYSARALGYKASTDTWPDGWAVWRSWDGPKSAGELPLGYVRGFIFVAFILWMIQILAEIIKNGFVLAGRHDLAEVKVSDVPMRIE